MSSDGEAFYQKLVVRTEIDFTKLRSGKISKQARKLIKQYNLTSLNGLLGEDWEAEARRLAEDRANKE